MAPGAPAGTPAIEPPPAASGYLSGTPPPASFALPPLSGRPLMIWAGDPRSGTTMMLARFSSGEIESALHVAETWAARYGDLTLGESGGPGGALLDTPSNTAGAPHTPATPGAPGTPGTPGSAGPLGPLGSPGAAGTAALLGPSTPTGSSGSADVSISYRSTGAAGHTGTTSHPGAVTGSSRIPPRVLAIWKHGQRQVM